MILNLSLTLIRDSSRALVPVHLLFDLLLYFIRHQSDRLGSVVCLVDTHKLIGQLEHVVPQRDDDELGIFGSLLDVLRDDRDVLVVKRCINLVHEVQRCWPVVMK